MLANSFLGHNSSLDVKDIVTTLTDTIALLGHAHVQLSYWRRDAMVPALKGSYGGLSSTDVPITNMLFGDDVVKTMGEVKKAKSVQYDAKSYTYPKSKNYRGHKERPMKYQQYHNKGKHQHQKKGRFPYQK